MWVMKTWWETHPRPHFRKPSHVQESRAVTQGCPRVMALQCWFPLPALGEEDTQTALLSLLPPGQPPIAVKQGACPQVEFLSPVSCCSGGHGGKTYSLLLFTGQSQTMGCQAPQSPEVVSLELSPALRPGHTHLLQDTKGAKNSRKTHNSSKMPSRPVS